MDDFDQILTLNLVFFEALNLGEKGTQSFVVKVASIEHFFAQSLNYWPNFDINGG